VYAPIAIDEYGDGNAPERSVRILKILPPFAD
jgi:hypothetical protein